MMPTATAPSTLSAASNIKMEDRKRAAQSFDELAPPTKRQAVNGARSTADDMPWKDDLEKFQKDAIYRQMLEYKREKVTLESQLREVQKKSTDHDDHLRVVDQWWSQLLDELRLLVEDVLPEPGDVDDYHTALNFKGSEEFNTHLTAKSREIKNQIQVIIGNIAAARGKPNVDLGSLQGKLVNLLASQREYMIKVDRLRAEKEELSERLETASLRYVKAEKRLDRAKSSAVAKLEAQANAKSTGTGIGGGESTPDTEMINGIAEATNEATQGKYLKAAAVVEKQKEQLGALAAENKSLTEQLTTANTKFTNVTEDDYARTELFKQFHTQHEDVIRRINHLEATNIQLRQEAEKLQAERTSHRKDVENEHETLRSESDAQLQRIETDLTRVRSQRDELLADQATRKAAQDHECQRLNHTRELLAARSERITALESEVARLRQDVSDQAPAMVARPEIDMLDLEALRHRYESLRQSFDAINTEMPALQGAYRRVQALTSKKVMDFAALEEKIIMLIGQKSKADQSYFGARKDTDTRIYEIKTLRAQNAKSGEIISQLKDVETATRTLLGNVEKQLADVKQANTTTVSENKKLEAASREASSKARTLESQISELTALLKQKDASNSTTKERFMAVERESQALTKRLELAQKERDHYKTKCQGNSSGEEEMLRTLALCTICRNNFKNTVLKGCGHLFCDACVDDRLTNRMRKCPNCAKPFDKSDVLAVHM